MKTKPMTTETVKPIHEERWSLSSESDSSKEIATIYNLPNGNYAYVISDTEYFSVAWNQRRARAAAVVIHAPEMLDALKKIDDEDGRHFHLDPDCRALLREALANIASSEMELLQPVKQEAA